MYAGIVTPVLGGGAVVHAKDVEQGVEGSHGEARHGVLGAFVGRKKEKKVSWSGEKRSNLHTVARLLGGVVSYASLASHVHTPAHTDMFSVPMCPYSVEQIGKRWVVLFFPGVSSGTLLRRVEARIPDGHDTRFFLMVFGVRACTCLCACPIERRRHLSVA